MLRPMRRESQKPQSNLSERNGHTDERNRKSTFSSAGLVFVQLLTAAIELFRDLPDETYSRSSSLFQAFLYALCFLFETLDLRITSVKSARVNHANHGSSHAIPCACETPAHHASSKHSSRPCANTPDRGCASHCRIRIMSESQTYNDLKTRSMSHVIVGQCTR